MGDEHNVWLRQAERDLNTAKVNLRERIYDASAFFSQQAAEKALKAFYIKNLVH